jgi:hypothetical protein
MMKGKKGLSAMASIIVVLAVLAIMFVILQKTGILGQRTLNTTVPSVPGVIGGEETQHTESSTRLVIMKVTEDINKQTIQGTPTSFDRTDWDPNYFEIDSRYITVYFDKPLKNGAIDSSYYEVYYSEDGEKWDDSPFVSFTSIDNENKAFKSSLLPRTGRGNYYIIRFLLGKQYVTKDGKNWTIAPGTATIKFELD